MTLNLANSSCLAVSLSTDFHNKRNLTGKKSSHSQSFTPRETNAQALIQHILEGKAWAQGYYSKGNRSKASFISSQTLALDFDDGISVDNALDNVFIERYALLIHPTPSSTATAPRTRVIFMLAEAVNCASAWEALQRGLIDHFEAMRPDPNCKDAARMFYGSDLPGAYVNLEARLPIELAGALTQREAAIEMERVVASRNALPPKKQHKKGEGKLFRNLVAEVERCLEVAEAAIGNSGFTTDPIPCPVRFHEHDRTSPAAYWHSEKKIVYCHKCHHTYLVCDIAAALNIGPQLIDSHARNPIIECHQLYISEYDLRPLMTETRTLLIKSPTGSGKTEGLTAIITSRAYDRILVITHRKSLATNLTKRLNQGLKRNRVERHFENYEGLRAPQLRQISHLVICLNSLTKLVALGQQLPPFDLVIMDEIEQQLAHLIGGTFDGEEAVNTYEILCHIVRTADQVVAMDAYAGNDSWEWLASVREKKRLQVWSTPTDSTKADYMYGTILCR